MLPALLAHQGVRANGQRGWCHTGHGTQVWAAALLPQLLDPQEAARKKAEEARAAAAAAKLQKQAAGSKKISQFFQAAKKAK